MQFATRVVGNLPRRVKLWSTTFVLILPSTFVLILPSTVELAPESSYLTGENRQPGRFFVRASASEKSVTRMWLETSVALEADGSNLQVYVQRFCAKPFNVN